MFDVIVNVSKPSYYFIVENNGNFNAYLVCTVNLIFIFIVNKGHGLLKKPIIKT